MANEKDFESEIAKALENADIAFEAEVAVGGLQPDFVIKAPNDRLFVVEAKTWEKWPGFTSRAARQAELYQSIAGVDMAFVVLKNLEKSRPDVGVVTFKNLINSIQSEFQKKVISRVKKPPQLLPPRKKIFVAMPFSDEYEDTYFVAMAPAAEKVGAACIRVDQEEYTGNIVDEIEYSIKSSDAIIADLSESRPNVLYETGFARGLNKKVIAICSTPKRDLPFDVAQWNVINYTKGKTYELEKDLTNRLRAVL